MRLRRVARAAPRPGPSVLRNIGARAHGIGDELALGIVTELYGAKPQLDIDRACKPSCSCAAQGTRLQDLRDWHRPAQRGGHGSRPVG
jgi:hypothetical protein